MNEINHRIKELRLTYGLTIAKLAEILQVSPGNISDWESDKKKSTPASKAMIAIAKYFNVSLDWLMVGKEQNLNPVSSFSYASESLPLEDLELLNIIALRLSRNLSSSVISVPTKKTSKLKPFTEKNMTIRETSIATEYYVKLPVVGRITAGNPITAIENIEEYCSVPRGLIGSGQHFILRVTGESMINAGIADEDMIVVRQQSSADNGDIVVVMTSEDEATVKTFYKEQHHIRLQPENDQMDPMLRESVTILGKVITVLKDSA